MISTAVGGDRLPSSISYCILTSGPEGWFLMSAEHIGSAEDLHDCLIFFSARARNSLDSELRRVVTLMWFSKSLSLPVGIRLHFQKFCCHRCRGTSRPSQHCSKEYILHHHHLHLQPCCPLLLPSHCFLPLTGHGRGSAASVELLVSLPLPVL
jgi:hypothetical protein